jgi:hypothetical protein
MTNPTSPPTPALATQQPACRRRRRRPLPPLLVSGPTAATLCGVSARTWATLNVMRKTPTPTRLNGRVLWNRRELARWVDAGCPDRQTWRAMDALTIIPGSTTAPTPLTSVQRRRRDEREEAALAAIGI